MEAIILGAIRMFSEGIFRETLYSAIKEYPVSVSHHIAMNESLIPYFGRIACLRYNGATIQETTAAYMSCAVSVRKKQDAIAYSVLKEITKIQMELFDENNAW